MRSPRLWNQHNLLWAVSSALLLTLGFAPWNQAWAGWIALLPISLNIRLNTTRLKETARLGWIFGFVHFASSLYWITYVSWLGWTVLAAYLALYPMFWTLFWHGIVRQNTQSASKDSPAQNVVHAFFGASAWVALEWLRSWLLGGFSWNMLGVTQVKLLALIQIADLGGVYLVSWVVAFTSLMLSGLAARTCLKFQTNPPQQCALSIPIDLLIACMLVLAATSYGGWKLAQQPVAHASLNYLAIQPNIEQKPWQRPSIEKTLSRLEELTYRGLDDMQRTRKGLMLPRGQMDDGVPNLILWPEAPLSINPIDHPLYREILSELLEHKPYSILAGGIYGEEDLYYNIAALVSNSGVNHQVYSYQIYAKRHLVIFGEYVPLAEWFPWLRIFVPTPIDLAPGKQPRLLTLENKPISLAPLLCFEDTVMDVVRDASKLNPDIWICPANNAWFGTSAAAWQHFDNALFRCIEYRKPMLRVANNGITAAIDEKGVIQALLSEKWMNQSKWKLSEPSSDRPIVCAIDEDPNCMGRSAGWMHGVLYIHSYEPTLYARHGAWAPKLCLILVMGFLFLARRRHH